MDRLARHPAVEPGGRLSDPDAGPGRTAALAVYRDPARPARPQRARMAFRHRDLDAGHGLDPVRRTKRHAAPSRLRSARSEAHTFELQSLMRISYAVFCL